MMILAAGCEKDKPMAPAPQPPANSAEFVEAFTAVYRAQDYATFAATLSPDFILVLDEPNPDTGETQWNVATERRIHQRMFDPQNIPTSDPPLPTDFWLQSVTITLTPEATFVERPDLYTTFDPPGPIDPMRWIASSCAYSYNAFFHLAGDTDFDARGRLYFTVLEDRGKQVGDPGKFLLVRWEELRRPPGIATEPAQWTRIKMLFR